MLQSDLMSVSLPPSSPTEFHRALTARLDAIAGVTEELAAWAAPLGVPDPTLARVGLMLDELMTNIVLHGYRGEAGVIEISAHVDQRSLTLTLVDEAFAYNPLLTPETDTTSALEARDIGGLGVQFVRRMADALHYERRQRAGREANALTLVKHF